MYDTKVNKKRNSYVKLNFLFLYASILKHCKMICQSRNNGFTVITKHKPFYIPNVKSAIDGSGVIQYATLTVIF